MSNKKNIARIIGILLIATLIAAPIAMAQTSDDNSSETLDTNTIKEVKFMNVPLGAEVRLLQLEKHLLINQQNGQVVINIVQKNHPDANTSGMEADVNQLGELASEIQGLNYNDTNMSAQKYVEIKSEGIKLVQDFRKLSQPLLDANDRREIKAEIAAMDKNSTNAIDAQIQGLANHFNAEKISALLGIMNASNPDLIAKINAGTATQAEIQAALKAAFNALTPEQKLAVEQLLKENVLRRVTGEKNILDKAKENLKQRIQERENERVQKIGQWIKNKELESKKTGKGNNDANAGDNNRGSQRNSQHTGDGND